MVTKGPSLQKGILSWPEQFLSEFACFFVKQNLIKYVPCIINRPTLRCQMALRISSYQLRRKCPRLLVSDIALEHVQRSVWLSNYFPSSPPISLPPFRESGNLGQGSRSVILSEIVFGQVRSRAILSHPRFPSSTLPGNPLFGLIA